MMTLAGLLFVIAFILVFAGLMIMTDIERDDWATFIRALDLGIAGFAVAFIGCYPLLIVAMRGAS